MRADAAREALFRTGRASDPRSDLHRAASGIARKVSTDEGIKRCQEARGAGRRVRERATCGCARGREPRAAKTRARERRGGRREGAEREEEEKRERERENAAKRATGVREPTEALCDD